MLHLKHQILPGGGSDTVEFFHFLHGAKKVNNDNMPNFGGLNSWLHNKHSSDGRNVPWHPSKQMTIMLPYVVLHFPALVPEVRGTHLPLPCQVDPSQ